MSHQTARSGTHNNVTSAQGNTVSRFIYGDKPNVPEYIIKGTTTYRVVTDQLGSPRLVINTSTGQTAQRIDYDPWGNITTDTNPGFQPFGYAGGLHEIDTGLVRFGGRDYDPQAGRWTARDPYFSIEGISSYEYANDDPLNFVDPYGTCPELKRFEDTQPATNTPKTRWDIIADWARDKWDKIKKWPGDSWEQIKDWLGQNPTRPTTIGGPGQATYEQDQLQKQADKAASKEVPDLADRIRNLFNESSKAISTQQPDAGTGPNRPGGSGALPRFTP